MISSVNIAPCPVTLVPPIFLTKFTPLLYGVVHKGRPQKMTHFPTPPPVRRCPYLINSPPPFRTSAFRIIHCSIADSILTGALKIRYLFIGLIIGAFDPYPMWAGMWVM